MAECIFFMHSAMFSAEATLAFSLVTAATDGKTTGLFVQEQKKTFYMFTMI